MTSRSLGNLYQLGSAIGYTRMLQLGMGEVLYKILPIVPGADPTDCYGGSSIELSYAYLCSPWDF
jgi:hypothetical protein